MGSSNTKSLADIMADDITDAAGKRAFRSKARALLKALTNELALEEGAFEISTATGEIEAILHADQFYVRVSQSTPADVMYAPCEGREDLPQGEYFRATSAELDNTKTFAQLLIQKLGLSSGQAPLDWDQLTLQKLSTLEGEELGPFADALREAIRSTIEEIGGHYASPLGAVDLTVAVHHVFRDQLRIIWDTGHQAYGHKVLTGRGKRMASLRKAGGVSGFPDPFESDHDHFGVGHAGTSIAAALGFLQGSEADSDVWTVPVIGDAALASGAALEALLLAKNFGGRLCVIVNDNNHSISTSVSALSSNPDRYRSLSQAAGMPYLGPVDGHDVSAMVEVLESVRNSGSPALVHVETIKGFGSDAATADPIAFHAIGGTRAKLERRPNAVPGASAHQLLLEKLAMLRPYKDISLITAGMGHSTGLAAADEIDGVRLLDVGIAEQAALTIGAADALAGGRPVVHIYSTFLQRAVDALIHDIGLHQASTALLVDRCGLSGEDGATHHGIYDLAFLRACPGMRVFSAATEVGFQGLCEHHLGADEGPVAIRIFKGPLLSPRQAHVVQMDGAFIHRQGLDLTILCHGRILKAVLEAADALADRGVSCRIAELTQLHPINETTVAEIVMAGKPVLIVEEHIDAGSVGEGLWPLIFDRTGDAGWRHLCIRDGRVPHGSVTDQWQQCGLDSTAIATEAVDLVQGQSE